MVKKIVSVQAVEPKPHPNSTVYLVPVKNGVEGTEFTTNYRTWEKNYKSLTAAPDGYASDETAKFKVKKKSNLK